MNMIGYMMLFVGDLIMATFSVYCWNKLLKTSKPFFTKKNTFLILIDALIVNISSYLFQNPLRIIIVSLMLIIVANNLTKKNFYKSVLLVFISQLILGLSEFIFAILSSLILKNNVEKFVTNPITYIFLNICLLIFSTIFLKTNIPSNIYKIFINGKKIKKEKSIIISSIMIISIMIIATTESYRNVPITVVLINNTIMVVIYIYIILKSKLTDNKLDKVNGKYQTSITSLKEYEEVINKFRVNTHENKNELLTIRNMIKSNDKKTIEYIDKLVDNKIKDNEKIMYQTSKIPEGGLRATIYSKLCVMEKYKIKYKLDISKNVRTVDLINLDEEVILNICKILGVFMDNSIEAVRNLKKKEINIELYVIDNKLYIDITNNFKGNIDISKIGHERHTTKGEDHGYGLLLVSKIINENKKYLENEKSINGNYFTQSLKIKIK